MSYDIFLFKKRENKSVTECAQEILESTTLNALDPESFEKQKTTLSTKLKNANPQFEEFLSDKRLELTADDVGIQVSIYPNQIAVTVPYWHTGETAAHVFTDISTYLSILQKETGYAIFDPQTGTEICVARDILNSVDKYLSVSEKLTGFQYKKQPPNAAKKIMWGIFRIVTFLFIIVISIICLILLKLAT